MKKTVDKWEKKRYLEYLKSISTERDESLLFYIFSHHARNDVKKMIRLKIFGKEIFLCGRCTFRYVSVVFSLVVMFLTNYSPKILYNFPFLLFLMMFLFPILSCTAWVYQFLTKKDNSRILRYSTGIMIGLSESVAISCILWLDLFLLSMYVILFTLYVGIVFIIVKKKSDAIRHGI